eukprot:RCo028244
MPSVHPTAVHPLTEDGGAVMTRVPSPRSPQHTSRSVTTSIHGTRGDQAGPRLLRLPLRVVVVAAMCIFTVGPAIALWMVSWQAGNNGVNSIHSQGQSSVEGVTVSLRASMMRSTRSAFMELVQPTETMIYTESLRFKSFDLLGFSGDTILANFSDIAESLALQYDLRGSRFVSMTDYTLLLPTANASIACGPYLTYAWFNIDVLTYDLKPTVYLIVSTPDPAADNTSVMVYTYVDQTALTPQFSFYSQVDPLYTTPTEITRPESFWWDNDLWFDPNSGVPQTTLYYQVPSTDLKSAHQLNIFTNVYTVSSFLRGLLDGSKQRLFVFFRTS